jgi:hypothetical protein
MHLIESIEAWYCQNGASDKILTADHPNHAQEARAILFRSALLTR